MKVTTTDKVIVSLAVIILTIAAILYSLQPTKQAAAVEFTAGIPSETVHINPVKPVKLIAWADSPAYFIPQYHNSPRVEFQCESPYFINGRVVNSGNQTGERFAGCQAVAEVKRDTDDTQTPIIVDVPVTPEQPVIIDNGGEEIPTEETEQPETEQPETDEPSQAGNPGNLKNVGNAGENPNGRGTMDNDNAGGNGNGQHGNQGEGGHGHNK